jgi:hypothetical protein
MASGSVAHLETRYFGDPGVMIVDDAGGTWVFKAATQFDLVVATVLHHIPDYLAAVARYADLTEPGGSFIRWQDPIWYSHQPPATLAASRVAYLAWRITQGNLRRGLATGIRRLCGRLDESNVSDMSEYHVVRLGVDESALMHLLRARYAQTNLIAYWSTQSAALQRVGDWLGLRDTFALVARGRLAKQQSGFARSNANDPPTRT